VRASGGTIPPGGHRDERAPFMIRPIGILCVGYKMTLQLAGNEAHLASSR